MDGLQIDWDNLPYTRNEIVFLKKLYSEFGGFAGNKRLRNSLGFSEVDYWETRDRLAQGGIIIIGKGKGGSASLIIDNLIAIRPTEESPAETQAEAIISFSRKDWEDKINSGDLREENTYPFFEKRLKWISKSYAFHTEYYSNTSRQGRRQTGGKWTRPDLVIMGISKYKFLPGKAIDIISFELKTFKEADISAVYEALAYTRFSTEVFLAILKKENESPDDAKNSDLIYDECIRHGIGLINFHIDKGETKEEIILYSDKFNPNQSDVDDFIGIQLTEHHNNILLDLK